MTKSPSRVQSAVPEAAPDVVDEDDLAIDDFNAPAAVGVPPPQYIDLDVLRNSDNLVAIISQRRASGLLTFAIFKEFERDRRFERSSFVAEQLLPSYRDLLDITAKRIEEIRRDDALLMSLQRAAFAKLRSPQQRTRR